MKCIIKYLVLLVLAVVLLISGCSREAEPEVVVATVGDRSIGADEFVLAYELAPRTVTSKPAAEARQAVLDGITKRILLADAAETAGLGDDPVLQRAVDLYRRQAVNRELYREHVRVQVTVSEAEERAAFERANKRLFVQHQAFDDLPAAEQASAGSKLVHEQIHPYLEMTDYGDYGPVDIIQWNDVDYRLDSVLCSLPLGEISKPVPYGGMYHLFKVVEIEYSAIKRESDFAARRESFNGVIRKQKEKAVSALYVHQVMTPQNVLIKADALNELTELVWRNRPQRQTESAHFLSNQEIKFIASSSVALMEKPLVEFASGLMTVADIIFHYKINPQKIDYSDKPNLHTSLTDMAGLFVRDWVLSEQGIREKLDDRPEVEHERLTRYEHLLAEKIKRQLYAELINEDSTTLEMTASEFETYLNDYVNQLRLGADIIINTENLMAVKTSDEGLSRKIDFVAVHTQ